MEIRKKSPIGVKGFSREKQRSDRERGKGQRGRARGRRLEKRRAWSLRFAGLTQVRGVYRRLMGIMG